MANRGRGIETESSSFITMEPSTGLTHIAIWYPDQNPNDIKKYPPTILYGRQGVWGNDYCNVRHVTLVNSYSGVVLSRNNGGGCPNIYELYGTPLFRGVEIDNIADVGRFDWIDFSPDYWAGSGLPGSPEKGGAYSDWIRKNGTGIVMRRNDWSYTCFVTIEGYNRGFHAGTSMVVNSDGKPNGHNYGFNLKNCRTAIYCDGVSGAGIMFTRVKATDCDNGVVVAANTGSTVQLYDCDIEAEEYAIYIDKDASTRLITQQCNYQSGKVSVRGGVFTSGDGDFNNASPQVSIGPNGRVILTGNRFGSEAEIDNKSLFECVIDHTPLTIKKLPSFPEIKALETKPARAALYNVFDFGAVADATVTDNTSAIQNALDKAAQDGGGIVFLPPGKYKVSGNLTVPTGVELKGASDLASVPKGPGSILEAYAGKGNPDGTPFIRLSERSGIRGLTIDYPEQLTSLLPDIPAYPYTIQGMGKDIYIVNIGIRAAYNGLDLFSYKCDNHYVDYLAGHAFRNAIRVGGGSENGRVCNMQFNTIVYANGYESKFGSWPNSIQEYIDAANDQNFGELAFIIMGDCKNQILYNDFHCIGHRGIVFKADNGKAAAGISLGLGIDAALRSVIYEAIDPSGFDLINSQIVSPNNKLLEETRMFETSPNFTGEITFFSSDYWGGAKNVGVLEGGTINLILPNFNTSGSAIFLNIPDDNDNAGFNIYNAYINNPRRFVSENKESQVSVESTITNPTSAKVNDFLTWENNLSISPVLNGDITLDRADWKATASNNNTNARRAIDGDISSRWDTGGSQSAGQWWAVDMRAKNKINTVILDAASSPNDGPAAYEIYVSDDGVNWGDPVVSGQTGSSVMIITFPEVTTQHIKVVQTGTKSSYWSIHEFYTAILDIDEASGINRDTVSNYAIFSSGESIYLKGFENSGSLTAELFNMSGRKVFSKQTSDNCIEIRNVQSGIYVVSVQSAIHAIRKKIFIK
jgi:hypothetical protein